MLHMIWELKVLLLELVPHMNFQLEEKPDLQELKLDLEELLQPPPQFQQLLQPMDLEPVEPNFLLKELELSSSLV